MKIQTFKNMRGLIHGADPMRIGCDKEGVLRIGSTEVVISPGAGAIMPLLFHGADGNYGATFTDRAGNIYELEKVAVRGGRITPPPATAVEIMDLRCRADAAEEAFEDLRTKIRELEGIFDTNSLNFLIN